MCRSWVGVSLLLFRRTLVGGDPLPPLELLDFRTLPYKRIYGLCLSYIVFFFFIYRNVLGGFNDLGFLMMLPQAAALITSGITKILNGNARNYVIIVGWVDCNEIGNIIFCQYTCWFLPHPCELELGLRPGRRWWPAGPLRRWLARVRRWRPRRKGWRLAPTFAAALLAGCPCNK